VSGAMGTVLQYNGNTWAAVSSGTLNSLNGIWGAAGTAQTVYVAGNTGTILHMP